MGSKRQADSRRRTWRGLRVGALVAGLLVLVAVPVALAVPIAGPTSNTGYVFAPSAAQGSVSNSGNLWKNANQTVAITGVPDADTTVTVTLATATNGGSFVNTTWTAPVTGPLSHDFTVSAEGSSQIEYWASETTASATYVETHHGLAPLLFINIDKTKPVTTPTGLASVFTQSNEGNWSNDVTHTVTLAASDAVSGMSTSGVRWGIRKVNSEPAVVTTYTVPVVFTLAKGSGGVVEGSNAVTYSAVDWAGNYETTRTGYVNIDTVTPTTTPSPALASTATTGWKNSSVLVTLNWTDVSSGVPTGGTSYRLNDGNLTIYGAPFTVSAEGSNKVTFRSVDRALNAEATQTAYVNIDETSPTVSVATSPVRSSGWFNKDVVLTLTGADSVSGVAKTQYRLLSNPLPVWTDAVSNQFTVLASDNAIETFGYQAVDNAGNASAAASVVLRMDSVKPHTYGDDVTGKAGKSISVKYKIKDNLSPKAQAIWIKIKNSKGKTVKSQSISGSKTINKWYSFKWKTNTKGTYKYYVYAKDLAGNPQSSAGWAKIKVK